MNMSNIKIRSNYFVTFKYNKLAIVHKDSFFKAINFIESNIEKVAFENLINKYQIVIPDVKILNGEAILNDYILINEENFKYFIICVRILIDDNYQLLKDKYQFDIFSLNTEFKK